MPDDQIGQSVDNLISETPDGDNGQATQASPTFSLGSNPSSTGGDAAASDSVAAPSSSFAPTSSNPPAAIRSTPAEPTDGQADDGSATDDGSLNVHNDSASDDLSQIKQQALSQLSPIVSELDQAPEEKFRTLMMLIQASDDQGLIKKAFDAANAIEDKKAKAEALLNVVNEINYFSGQTTQQPEISQT